MSSKNEVGSLIYKGFSSKEIKKRIPDFPLEPSKEYFMSLGYSIHTARNYKVALKKNNAKVCESSVSSIDESHFLTSLNANENNIILDTSALNYEESVELMKNSFKVSIIYSVIREFDSVIKKKNISNYLRAIIREQTLSMLQNKTGGKYRLIPWNWKSDGYTDNLILEYIESLPINERPTLLTGDQNLALKAKCLGFEYILYIPKNIKSDTSDKPKSSIIEDLENIRKYNPAALIFSVKSEHCKNILDISEISENVQVDYYAVVVRSKKGYVKVQKLQIVSDQKQKIDFKCYIPKDIEQLNDKFHKIILNSIKVLL